MAHPTIEVGAKEMTEKRKIKRRYLLYYMRVYDAITRQQIGSLVDITPGGIMIVGEHTIPVGQTFHLRMELTYEVAEKPYMEFSALSKWSKPDISPSMYNSGFEISDLSPEDAVIIRHIVDSFGFRDNILKN
jgi:hypothetical protein